MSHHLGIKVIAEGVETPDHLRFLTERQCDEAQGYYFSRPVAAAGFAAAVDFIHRLFDERQLHADLRVAPSESETARYDADRKLDEQASTFPLYHAKQVVM
jgi:predicted signal transduction protein with EAL and GGDEF domain